MKKLIAILGVLAITVGMAFGQNNVADVMQNGTGNEGEVVQTGEINNAEITQYGSNTSVVNQTGTDNDAIVNMGEDGRPVTNLDTDSWRYGAFVDQIGDNNTAEIKVFRGDGTYQYGGGSNGARVEQYGNGNEAYQEVSNSQVKTSNWDRMGLHIIQEGDANFANQEIFRSFGTHGSGGVIINQLGNDNEASQYIIGGRQNVTEVFQTGDNNTYTGFQNTEIAEILEMDWAFLPVGEDFSQFQRGERSELTLNIEGSNNITAQYQEGIWGYSYNVGNIDIAGDSNEAAQAQLGTHNEADIFITGNLNMAGTQQAGEYHNADITQFGDGNFSTIIQNNLP